MKLKTIPSEGVNINAGHCKYAVIGFGVYGLSYYGLSSKARKMGKRRQKENLFSPWSFTQSFLAAELDMGFDQLNINKGD